MKSYMINNSVKIVQCKRTNKLFLKCPVIFAATAALLTDGHLNTMRYIIYELGSSFCMSQKTAKFS